MRPILAVTDALGATKCDVRPLARGLSNACKTHDERRLSHCPRRPVIELGGSPRCTSLFMAPISEAGFAMVIGSKRTHDAQAGQVRTACRPTRRLPVRSDPNGCLSPMGRHSIISSAAASKVFGTVRPSALAVLRLSVLQRDTEKKGGQQHEMKTCLTAA